MLFGIGAAAQAADVVKIGNLTQLSGPLAAPGNETKRGIDLALEELGNKVGGLPLRYFPVDDKANPAEAINGASKLIDDLKVDFVTGLGASNTLIPVFKSFVDANIFVVGALAGPRQFAGKRMSPEWFLRLFHQRRLARRRRPVHDQQELQAGVLPRRRLPSRQGAYRGCHSDL